MKPESLTLAEAMADFLREHGRQSWTGSAWDEPSALAHVAELDLLITLGGDGTMLRAARIGSRYGVPILGVKLGRVELPGEVPPENWREPLTRMLAGDYWLEERMLLDVAVERCGLPDDVDLHTAFPLPPNGPQVSRPRTLLHRAERGGHQPRRAGAPGHRGDLGRSELSDHAIGPTA